MSTPNPVPTLPQAQAALILVQMCESQLATLNQQLTTYQGQVTSLQNYNPANDLAAAQAQVAALTNAIALMTQAMATPAATIAQYNAANPAAPITAS